MYTFASLIFEYNKIRYVCINFKTLGARESEGAHGQDGSWVEQAPRGGVQQDQRQSGPNHRQIPAGRSAHIIVRPVVLDNPVVLHQLLGQAGLERRQLELPHAQPSLPPRELANVERRRRVTKPAPVAEAVPPTRTRSHLRHIILSGNKSSSTGWG